VSGAGGLYDRIGRSYSSTRRPDPRLEAAIWSALGDARTVVNVGAGTGAYEPSDREVVAVEPSVVMIAQRPAGSAEVVQAQAERLPFADGAFDAAMAVLSDHHWRDRGQGLRELARVARRRVVLFNADPAENARFWMTTEYLPGFIELIDARYRVAGARERELRAIFGAVRLVAVPIPHDCVDGFYGAYWRRPDAFLEPEVRAGISVFAQVPPEQVQRGIAALSRDLESGLWQERHRDLLELEQLHLGYYVGVAELAG
jgi:SAM-dependent methyltransferase